MGILGSGLLPIDGVFGKSWPALLLYGCYLLVPHGSVESWKRYCRIFNDVSTSWQVVLPVFQPCRADVEKGHHDFSLVVAAAWVTRDAINCCSRISSNYNEISFRSSHISTKSSCLQWPLQLLLCNCCIKKQVSFVSLWNLFSATPCLSSCNG